MSSSNISRWSGLPAVTILTIGALWILNVRVPLDPGWVPHSVSNLTAGVVGMLVAVWAVWLRRLLAVHFPKAGRTGPLMLVAGSAWFALSQMVETLSAVIEYPSAGIIHTASGLSTVLGLLITVIGAAVTALAAITRRRPARGTAVFLILSIVGIFGLYVLLGITLGF